MVALAATQRVSCVPVKSLTAHPQLEVQAKRLCVLFSTTKESTLFNMSSTSMKHRNFVSEPMGDKPATDLAGIGETLSKRLASKGYDKAYIILGQFLVLKKDPELFAEWLKEICQANSKQANDCSQCLSEWCEQFL